MDHRHFSTNVLYYLDLASDPIATGATQSRAKTVDVMRKNAFLPWTIKNNVYLKGRKNLDEIFAAGDLHIFLFVASRKPRRTP